MIRLAIFLFFVSSAYATNIIEAREGTSEDRRRFGVALESITKSQADIASGTLFVYSYLNSHLSPKDTSYTENLWLTVTNPGTQPAQVTIWSAYPGFMNQTNTVPAGTSKVYPINPVSIQVDYMDLQQTMNITLETKSIWVQSDNAVKLVATNQLSDGSSEDKFAVLPVCQLGKSYLVVGDESARAGTPQSTNIVTVIATQPNTHVTFLGAAAINLQPGMQFTTSINSYVSGIPVTATKPVAVISGAVCGYGYLSQPQIHCSHEALMLYPTTSFDTRYPYFNFQPEEYGELMVYVAQKNTTISLDNRARAPMDTNSILLVKVATGVYITADKPIYTVAVGNVNSQDQGAPFFAHVPSPSLFTTGPIMFATAMTDYESSMYNFARVITDLKNIGNIAVDKYVPNGLIYRRMGQSDYYFVDVSISAKDNHVVSSMVPGATFAVTVYGYGQLKSYAFNPGLNLPVTGTC